MLPHGMGSVNRLCKATKSGSPTGKATLGAAGLRVQHRFDGFQRARAEAIVVALVAGRRARKHDEVAVLTARRTLLRIVLWVGVGEKERKGQ